MMNINSCLDLHTLGFRNSAPRCARLHRRALHMARGRVDDGGALGSCVKGRKGGVEGRKGMCGSATEGRRRLAHRRRGGRGGMLARMRSEGDAWLASGGEDALRSPAEGRKPGRGGD